MARNANNQASNAQDKVVQPALDGTFPARIVQLVFMGVQEQRAFQGQVKPDVDMVRITYELSHEFMVNEEGELQADKPRWYSEKIPFHNSEVDLATSTKRFKAFVPTVGGPAEHNWSDELLGTAVQVQLSTRKAESGKHAGKTFTDVKGVTSPAKMPGYVQPELLNGSLFFDPQGDTIDLDVFNTLPDWLKDDIKKSKDFDTSPLKAALAGGGQSTTPEPAEVPEAAPSPNGGGVAAKDEDSPY